MAIKDQCVSCRKNQLNDRCTIFGVVSYDGYSCNAYQKQGINLSKCDTDNNSYNVNTANPIASPVKKGMFQHPFSFKGRIRRTEYCLTYLVYCLFYLPMNIIEENEIKPGFALFWLLLLIPLFWLLIAQGAKRCHDRGNSGWYQLIPFYGLWMLFATGDANENYYGKSPK